MPYLIHCPGHTVNKEWFLIASMSHWRGQDTKHDINDINEINVINSLLKGNSQTTAPLVIHETVTIMQQDIVNIVYQFVTFSMPIIGDIPEHSLLR